MIIEKGKWLIDINEQYSQFFKECSWYTYNPILVEFESDVSLGACEITVVIMGLYFRVRWNHTETDEWKDIRRMIDEIEGEIIE